MKETIPKFIISELLQEIESNCDALLEGSLVEGSNQWKKCYYSTQRALALCQESGDEKLRLLTTITEHIENRGRQLEQNLENLGETLSKMHVNIVFTLFSWFLLSFTFFFFFNSNIIFFLVILSVVV